MVGNPELAQACFDPTMSTVDEGFRGNTPSEEMAALSEVATWLDRPTYAESFPSQDAVDVFIRSFADDFLPILRTAVKASHWPSDPTIGGLEHLWASVGWIPFYATRAEAGSERFRGGYAYSEIMGPFGMLKIDEINGEKFQGEIGLTVQRAGTFYAAHFHYPQEVYIILTPPACADQQKYLLIDEAENVAESTSWAPFFIPMDPEDEWLSYIDTQNLHSFIVEDCAGNAVKTGLVTAWARTISRDDRSQSTNICTGADGVQPENFEPDTAYECATDANM